MSIKATSIRPFIGAKNYEISRRFYRDLGFEETVLLPKLSVFKTKTIGFYLQDYDAKEWIDNTMVFLEVEDVERHYDEVSALNLHIRYENVRLIPIREMDWGREFFLYDPSGILWHFGEFKQ